MPMYFESFSALLSMSGHGVYVWMAYGLAAVILSWLIISPLLRKKRFLEQLRMQLRRIEAAPKTVNYRSMSVPK